MSSGYPDLPTANRHVIAAFMAKGFVGAIEAWIRDDTLTKQDLVDAAAACAPIWWS